MKHPLDGVKVVDLASYISGAYCSSLLADMGAKVTKVESPSGDGFRAMGGGFQGWNRGKRGMVLNLMSDEGRDILYRMVSDSDVVVENYRKGVSEKLGADYESLKNVNPRIIYCTVTGYGTTGPYSEKPAFDPMIQAESGIMLAQGTDNPVHLRVAVTDYAASILAAFGVSMALFHRVRTGRGQRLETSLLDASVAIQAEEFLSYSSKESLPLENNLGLCSTYGLYQAADGWLFLSCDDNESWYKLCVVLERTDLAKKYCNESFRKEKDTEIRCQLESIFSSKDLQYWLDNLQAAGVKVSPSGYSWDMHKDPQAMHMGLTVDADSPDAGPIQQMGLPFKFSSTPGKIWGPSPGLGQHTDQLLSEMGISQEEIDVLRERGVVA